MALSLFGERSIAAATPINPAVAVRRWIARAQAGRARRLVLQSLLELEPSRLNDLGIEREDVLAALALRGSRVGSSLNAVRARNARRGT